MATAVVHIDGESGCRRWEWWYPLQLLMPGVGAVATIDAGAGAYRDRQRWGLEQLPWKLLTLVSQGVGGAAAVNTELGVAASSLMLRRVGVRVCREGWCTDGRACVVGAHAQVCVGVRDGRACAMRLDDETVVVRT